MTKKTKAEVIEHEVSAEDIANNPGLSEEGVVEGDVVEMAAEVTTPKAKKDKNSATVTWQGQSRTYTREIHGDNFSELAEEFAEKKGGTVA